MTKLIKFPGCLGCELVDDPRSMSLGPYWTLNANVAGGNRPRLVMQTRQHRGGLDELDEPELQALARLLPKVEVAFRAATGAAKIYVLYLNEQAPPHVHLHLVPRFEADTIRGADLVEEPLPAGVEVASSEVIARAVGERIATAEKTFGIVTGTVNIATAVQRRMPYRPLAQRFDSREGGSKDFAPFYVAGWMVVLLIALLAAAPAGGAAAWIAVAVGVYRLVDLASFQVLILVHPEQRSLAAVERSVVLLGLNLVELVIAAAIFLIATEHDRIGTALVQGFAAVTLFGLPTTSTAVGATLSMAAAATALLLIAGGLSLLVGLIGDSFRSGD